MIILSTIINTFEETFLEKYKNSILPSHKKALHAMKRCRSEQGLYMQATCSDPDCTERVDPAFLRTQELSPLPES